MRIALTAIALVALAGTAEAASTTFRGVKLSCPAARAVRVVPSVPSYAQADLGSRVIYLGASNLADMTRNELRHIMAHECGHLVMGASEYAADAYAARTVRPTAKLCAITGRCGGGAPAYSTTFSSPGRATGYE